MPRIAPNGAGEWAGARFPVAVIGGGQAGLAMSYRLREQGIVHIVLEAEQGGHEWRERR